MARVRITEWIPPGFESDRPEAGADPVEPGVEPTPDQRLELVAEPAAPVWLAAEPVVERIDLDERCWVDVVRGLVPDADRAHADLVDAVAWQQGQVFRYERWIDEPRLGAWQVGSGRHPALVEAQGWMSARYRVSFDGVALAHYRNGRDSVAWHRDRELKWLDDTLIGVLTLGARRPWLVRPLTGRRAADDTDLADALDLSPASGDLLVLGGATQDAWLHAVPKTRASRSRISAQWRWTSRRGRPDGNPSYYAPRHYTG